MLASPLTGYLPELLSFMSTCIFSSDPRSQLSYIYRLLTRLIEGSLHEMFIPFIPSHREEFVYHMMFQNKELFRRWRCAKCMTIFCVIDCGMLAEESESTNGVRRGASVRSVCMTCNAELSIKAFNEKKILEVDKLPRYQKHSHAKMKELLKTEQS